MTTKNIDFKDTLWSSNNRPKFNTKNLTSWFVDKFNIPAKEVSYLGSGDGIGLQITTTDGAFKEIEKLKEFEGYQSTNESFSDMVNSKIVQEAELSDDYMNGLTNILVDNKSFIGSKKDQLIKYISKFIVFGKPADLGMVDSYISSLSTLKGNSEAIKQIKEYFSSEDGYDLKNADDKVVKVLSNPKYHVDSYNHDFMSGLVDTLL